MTLIDPVQSLAFSMQANPGAYALLLGSGVSRGAGIPTGWEIVLDLLGKLATVSGQPPNANLEEWYTKNYGIAPDYSQLLDALAKTQAERQQLLRPYFEPTQEDREDGLKQPTTAHRAIAQLAVGGYIKVIVTVNFDRLIEQALEDAGIVPTVLSSPDQIAGALPLIHTPCCVLKVHGDYLDTRIRNSPTELQEYPQEVNQLLARIFDEFGVIVCGWSAAWDDALRKAIERAPSRRFTTYWALKGEVTDEAKRLIDHRAAQVIPITTADDFFQTLQQTVESLEEYAKPHPLSTAATVAALKRYLLRSEDRIRLEDLIDATVEQVVNTTREEGLNASQHQQVNTEVVESLLQTYEATCSTLLAMAPIGGYWATNDNFRGWESAVKRLTFSFPTSYSTIPEVLLNYPGALLMCGLGIGAVKSDNLGVLARIFDISVNQTGAHVYFKQALTTLLGRASVISLQWELPWDSAAQVDVLFLRRMRYVLRPLVRELVPSDGDYSQLFDYLETLIGLGVIHRHSRIFPNQDPWAPLGELTYHWQNWENMLTHIRGLISKGGDASPLVASGIFGETVEECLQSVNNLSRFAWEVARSRGLWWRAQLPSSPP